MLRLKKIILLLVTLSMVFILTSCYEDYLIISSKFKDPIISKDSSKIFFLHYLQAGQPAKGISRFPDGGTHHVIYQNASIYEYDINKKQLTNIFDFGKIPFHQPLEHIAIGKENLVFSISPLMGWHWIKNYYSDSIYQRVYDEYKGYYKYNISKKQLKQFKIDGFYPELSPNENQIAYFKRDSTGLRLWYYNINTSTNVELKKFENDSPFKPLIWKDNIHLYLRINGSVFILNTENKTWKQTEENVSFYPNQIPIKKVKELTSEFTFSDWGFKLTDYFQKDQKHFIDDIILLNGNLNYRNAIIQSIGKDLSKKDIENILSDIEKRKQELESYEKSKYEYLSKETADLLKELLKQK